MAVQNSATLALFGLKFCVIILCACWQVIWLSYRKAKMAAVLSFFFILTILFWVLFYFFIRFLFFSWMASVWSWNYCYQRQQRVFRRWKRERNNNNKNRKWRPPFCSWECYCMRTDLSNILMGFFFITVRLFVSVLCLYFLFLFETSIIGSDYFYLEFLRRGCHKISAI